MVAAVEEKGGVGRLLGSFSWPTIVKPNFVTPHPTFSRPHYVKLKFSWLN